MNKRWDEPPTEVERTALDDFLRQRGTPGKLRSEIARANTRREAAGIIRQYLRTAPKANS